MQRWKAISGREFDIVNYEQYFPKQLVEITCWSLTGYDAIHTIFSQEPIKALVKSLLAYFQSQLERHEELNCVSTNYSQIGISVFKYLYPGDLRKYSNVFMGDLLGFLQCVLGECEEDKSYYYQMIIPCLAASGAISSHNEPDWVVHRRLLDDVLGLLQRWAFFDEEKDIEKILNTK